jgi:hypothetical protein
MASILELYGEIGPKTGQANLKGKDTTPIGNDNPRGEFNPSLDLASNETKLQKARGGTLNTKKYTDTLTKK